MVACVCGTLSLGCLHKGLHNVRCLYIYVVMFGLARAKIRFIYNYRCTIVWDPSRVGVEAESRTPLRLHDETERVGMETQSCSHLCLRLYISAWASGREFSPAERLVVRWVTHLRWGPSIQRILSFAPTKLATARHGAMTITATSCATSAIGG